jgi:hypothetical protein
MVSCACTQHEDSEREGGIKREPSHRDDSVWLDVPRALNLLAQVRDRAVACSHVYYDDDDDDVFM